nr:MAG TPA: hypothetical protein [Ackermannviridae sp.]
MLLYICLDIRQSILILYLYLYSSTLFVKSQICYFSLIFSFR